VNPLEADIDALRDAIRRLKHENAGVAARARKARGRAQGLRDHARHLDKIADAQAARLERLEATLATFEEQALMISETRRSHGG
jgi:predicted nuclease with TOPRIM domain